MTIGTDGRMLDAILGSYDLPVPVREYRFHPARRWRVDYAWPDHKLAVEIEGAVWCQGRHTRGSGFVKDIEKYNALTLAGWSLLRFTPAQVRSGECYQAIHRWFNEQGTESRRPRADDSVIR